MTELSSITALIIDDEPQICYFFVEILKRQGIQSFTAENGQQALELLEQQKIDFIITDVKMPVMDGIELTKKVRQDYEELPIVLISGYSNEDTVIMALRAGANNFLKKPIEAHEFYKVVLPIVHTIEQKKSQAFDYSVVRQLSDEFCLTNDITLIPGLVDYLLQHLKTSPYSSRLHGLKIALYEMIVNAIEHGNLEITQEDQEEALEKECFEELVQERLQDPDYQHRQVYVQYEYSPIQLSCTIVDEGKGFDWRQFPNALSEETLFSKRGRGIMMAQMYCDEVRYNEKGNQVTLIIRNENASHAIPENMSSSLNSCQAHILVVEDNPLNFEHIKDVLEKLGYSFGGLPHPNDLFILLEHKEQKNNQFDLILMDIHMPEINGIMLLKQLKAHSVFQKIPVIMLTGETNHQTLAECFEHGAEDFINKPVSPLVLKSRIQSVLNRQKYIHQIQKVSSELATQYELLSKTQIALEKKHQQIQEDVYLAANVQKATLPPPPNLPFLKTSIIFQPRSIVSGDIYFMSEDDTGSMRIFLGDATGHGISAALLSMLVRMGLEQIKLEDSSDKILKQLNTQLASCIPKDDYITGIYLKITPQGVLKISSAGNTPGVLLSTAQQDITFLTDGGQALGMFPQERIPYTEEIHHLKPGDKVLLYTDGILEWTNKAHQAFGIERLENYLIQHKEQEINILLTGLLEYSQEFAQRNPCQDDLTLLGFQFLG